MIQLLHRTIRMFVAVVGAAAFLIAGGLGAFLALGELWTKLSGAVFGNTANDAVAFLLVGLFGAIAYLMASIDRRLEERRL
ncbi:hypothetical protein [Brevundimonas sp.]|uniref:hypothetical protein n=1 Tax=Brevundimonas sp. TaxID=1871086 RepID=UPI001AC43F3E|nr:hypothetical protein [Brevundimonas sp.]MBN9465382.1 hypothetical protein [Brevundimonas sp.]